MKCWRMALREGAPQKRIYTSCWTSWIWATTVPLQQRQPTASWAVSVIESSQQVVGVILPLYLAPVRPHTCSAMSSFGGFGTRKILKYWSNSSREQERWSGSWRKLCTQRGWENWVSSAWRRDSWDFIVAYNYIIRGYRKDRERLFSEALRDKLEPGKTQLGLHPISI